MNITGSNNRLIKFFTKLNDFTVDLPQIFLTVDLGNTVTANHKFIIAQRLYFQVIIVIYNPCNPFFRLVIQNCLIQFTRLTGTS